MSDRLRTAFKLASQLPEADQVAFADFLIAQLGDRTEWSRCPESSLDLTAPPAPQGRTRRLNELVD
jgi:hypothetical protein